VNERVKIGTLDRYRAVIDALPDSLHAKDRHGIFMAANPAAANLIAGADVEAVIGRSAANFCAPETAALIAKKELGVMTGEATERFEEEIVRANGERFWLSTLRAPFRDAKGDVVGVITHNREITDKKLLEIELAAAQNHLTDALSSMADGLALFNAAGELVFTNPLTADVRVPGNSLASIIAASLARNEIVISKEATETVDDIVGQLTAESGSREILMVDGRWLQARTRSTRAGGSMVMFSDISKAKQDEAALREMNDRLYSLAQTDGLTGLTNRRAFDKRLDAAITEAKATNGDLGLLMIDVDKFKLFNDTHGHPEGDRCLRLVAECLTQVVSAFPSATVGRYGGEEFGIVLPKMNISESGSVGRLVVAAVRTLGHGTQDPIADVP
jgi:diguanylate cyclase (GGDEF)-like protein/PAS domain S-box-containing protein